jgi:hypothetical protein
VVAIRTGLGFLFLLPIGVLAYCCTNRTAWLGVFTAVVVNGLFSLGVVVFMGYNALELLGDALYFSVMVSVFAWISAPPFERFRFLHIPGVYRLIIGSVIGALAFLPVLAAADKDTGVAALLRSQAELAASLYTAASGADVVQRTLLEQYVTADAILNIVRLVALRGGAVVSCLLLFFISRQISLFIARFTRRIQAEAGIIGFHVMPGLIWALSVSLLSIVFCLAFHITALEILAWNVLVICIMLYLAQGGGIALYLLTTAALPQALRIVLNCLFIVLLFSPGINAVLLGGIVLLGIAENWVPFRAPKSNGPSSTPGM